MFLVVGRFLAVFQVQEVDRKVEEIKAVIIVYCCPSSGCRVTAKNPFEVNDH